MLRHSCRMHPFPGIGHHSDQIERRDNLPPGSAAERLSTGGDRRSRVRFRLCSPRSRLAGIGAGPTPMRTFPCLGSATFGEQYASELDRTQQISSAATARPEPSQTVDARCQETPGITTAPDRAHPNSGTRTSITHAASSPLGRRS